MSRLQRLLLVLLFGSLTLLPAQAQLSFTCDNLSVDNAVEVTLVQLRAGNTYTATVIGLGDFDPVVIALNDQGRGVCADDSPEIEGYVLDLPTTGEIYASNRAAQLTFSQDSGFALSNVRLMVGSASGQTGEFVLIVDGLAVTGGDGAGDMFAVRMQPNNAGSGAVLNAYMFARVAVLDPFLYVSDGNGGIAQDGQGKDAPFFSCDDAGTNSCYGSSFALGSNYLPRVDGSLIGGQATNAMLSLPVFNIDVNALGDESFITFGFISFQGGSAGDYLAAFHMSLGSGDGGSAAVEEDGPPEALEEDGPEEFTEDTTGNVGGGGIPFTCAGNNIENGAEITIVQARAGATYTATVIGLGDFDPVIAVLNDQNRGTCTDDNPEVEGYTLDLPTTGEVYAGSRSAQLSFSQDSGFDFSNLRLLIGSANGGTGDFVLILDGMAVTGGDGLGDTFRLRVLPNNTTADSQMVAYMFGVVPVLDPLIYAINADGEPLQDGEGKDAPYLACDDGGTQNCYSPSFALGSSYVTRAGARVLEGRAYAAMLALPVARFGGLDFSQTWFYTVAMTSSGGNSVGDYVAAFHMSIR